MKNFNIGDTVRAITPYSDLVSGKIGKIIGFDIPFIAVEFENFDNGHSCYTFNTKEHLLDRNSESGFFLFPEDLQKIEVPNENIH